jgi:hypothetical protein
MFTREHAFQFKGSNSGIQFFQNKRGLFFSRCILLFSGKFQQYFGLFQRRGAGFPVINRVLEAADLFLDYSCLFSIIPETGFYGLGLEFFYLLFLIGNIKDAPLRRAAFL